MMTTSPLKNEATLVATPYFPKYELKIGNPPQFKTNKIKKRKSYKKNDVTNEDPFQNGFPLRVRHDSTARHEEFP